MSDQKSLTSSQDMSIDSQSRIYNKQLFMQTLSQLSTFQDLPQSTCFKKAQKVAKSNLIEVFKDQKLSTIEALDISGLELVSLEDQPEFDELSSLEMLNASNNLFMNVSDFLRFNSLVYLDLSSNQITSLYCIDMLAGLKTLVLRDNKLEDVGPLAVCQKLKTLDLANNKLGQLFDCLNNLKQLKKLKKLDLAGNPLCLSYMYKHETLLQLRGLQQHDGEKVTEADFEISEKLKQKYFEVNENSETGGFSGKSRFSKKLRALAESNKDELGFEADGEMVNSDVDRRDLEIARLKEELAAKDECIVYLESELMVEKTMVKAYEMFKLENQELKVKLANLTQSLGQTDCRSLACKERYLGLVTSSSMYIDEVRDLKRQMSEHGIQGSKSMVMENREPERKLKEYDIRKQRRMPNSATTLSQFPMVDTQVPPKPVSLNDAEEVTEAELEEFLKSTIIKLDEAKSLLKEIPAPKPREPPVPSKATILLAKKLGQKKSLNFLKDKKLVPLPKPL